MAIVFFAAVSRAAPSPTPPSLIGATREQVLSRYGEPKSQIAAGNRVVMYYGTERIVLRDGVVVDIEPISAEPRRAAPAPTPPSEETTPVAGSTAAPAAGAATAPTALPSPPPTQPQAAPAAPMAPATSSATIDRSDGKAPIVTVVTPAAPPPEPKLAIKLVRPPSANYTRPAPIEKSAPVPAVATATAIQEPRRSTPPPAPSSGTDGTLAQSLAVNAPAPGLAAPSARPASDQVAGASSPAAAGPTEVPAATAASADSPAAKAAEDMAAKKERSEKAQRRRTSEANAPEPKTALFTTQTYLIGFLVVAAFGYLIWRSRQRRLELEATSVSRTPFHASASTGASGGALFHADFLAKLEWKRFEELVAAYYSKTGVIAVRTKSGPNSPVQIKISWKGEPRPFAFVRCIVNPVGLIDVGPVQDLVAVLTAEDIRRGYVVSTGKFSVGARDFAEEKHITLLPGDIFLEKLNALPDAARNEIMHTITAGDFTTPSCPKCEAKMVQSADDPTQWRCPVHSEQLVAGRR